MDRARIERAQEDGTKLRVMAERLSDDEIQSRLEGLEGWEREGDAIVEPAEDMGHHPDLSISWDEVAVSITTHAEGGLTENDFELAKRIDEVASR